jgi:DNA polymerase-3 subunit gamma/tau
MRDALSLLDQVIAFGGNRVTAEDTRTMLGTLDRSQVFTLVDAVASRDARQVLACVDQLDERAPDYREVLAELAAVFQKIALMQAVPDLQLDEAEDLEVYKRLAATLTPEDAQLFYQITIMGRRDLELAPDARAGFEMVLLRMLAFGVSGDGATATPTATPLPQANRTSTRQAAPVEGRTQQATQPAALATTTVVTPVSAPRAASGVVSASDWPQIVAQLNLQGSVTQLAAHCGWIGKQGKKISLQLDADGEPFRRPALEDRLTQALSAYFGESVQLDISQVAEEIDTPARQRKAAADDRLQNARVAIDNDPNIRALRDTFGATVQPDSVRPLD